MGIAGPGWRFIAFGVGAAFVGWIVARIPSIYGLGVLVEFLAGLFIFFCAYFFRDPRRVLPAEPGKIYAPGDGVVLSVADEGQGGATLRIFLSVFDVHVQRAPCAGAVESVVRHAGGFVPAMRGEAGKNARAVMRLKPEGRDPLVVEQITGIIARRIEVWVKEGDRLASGQRYGMIHFGSQVALHFPASARCAVKPGDRVAAGVSVVGEWTDKP